MCYKARGVVLCILGSCQRNVHGKITESHFCNGCEAGYCIEGNCSLCELILFLLIITNVPLCWSGLN